MNIAEKIAQKLNNLLSKNEILDYFLYFDESRSLNLRVENGGVGQHTHPTHYKEIGAGVCNIVWDNKTVSRVKVGNAELSNFDEFIENARKTSKKTDHPYFIPPKTIYPMIRTYSKPLADIIDLPEYILKIADIIAELDQMLNNPRSYTEIELTEGTVYGYSSKALDDYYLYTRVKMHKVFLGELEWIFESADIPSIAKFQEILSFWGDQYNWLNNSKKKPLKDGIYNVVIPPHIFQEIFTSQVIENIKGSNIYHGRSIFTPQDFSNRLKILGNMSLSYDPLQNLMPGSYKFTNFGAKPQRQYFVKFGKLDTPILDAENYDALGYKTPTVEIKHFLNFKFEGLRNKHFKDITKKEEVIYFPGLLKSKKRSTREWLLLFNKGVYFDVNDKKYVSPRGILSIDLFDVISKGGAELVEFVDGQLGLQILEANLHFV